jgi:prepilin-type N-terminal cleavage/methylation domain-containing protein
VQRNRAARGDRGDSLIEILVAVAVLGIAVTALMAGLATEATTTVSNRSQSKAATVLNDAAEYVKGLSLSSVPTCSPNSVTTITTAQMPHDSGFTVTYGPASDFNASTPCSVMAKVPVTVSGDGYNLTVTVVRRA